MLVIVARFLEKSFDQSGPVGIDAPVTGSFTGIN